MGRVVVLGSLNVDLVTHVERHPRPGETVLADGAVERYAGGKGGNQALAAAEAGAHVVLVGAVGDDEPGAAYLSRLRGRGIDVDAVRVVDRQPTGQAWIVVDDDAENSIVVIAGANAHVTAELPELGPGDVLLAQLEVPVPVVARAARAAHSGGARVVINAAPYAALPHDVAALADPLVVNEHEAMQLADSDVVPRSLLVTFGGAGSSWDGVRHDGTPVAAEDVVDTTGAGDTFVGILASSLDEGLPVTTALERACRGASLACLAHGAQTGMPIREQLGIA